MPMLFDKMELQMGFCSFILLPQKKNKNGIERDLKITLQNANECWNFNSKTKPFLRKEL